MIAITCVTKDNGISFNNRRPSWDRKVMADILRSFTGASIGIPYQAKHLFTSCGTFKYSPKYKEKYDICYTDQDTLKDDKPAGLVLYRWNRDYPTDKKLELDLNNYRLIAIEDIQGYSHDIICKEVYERM